MTTTPFGFCRVGAAAPRLRVADPDFNASRILEVLRDASARGVQVLVLPELALTGYTCADLFFSGSVLIAGAERALARILAETAASQMIVAIGLPVAADGLLFNAAAVVQGGRVRGVVPKTYLPNYREFYEKRWFASSRAARSGEVTLAAARVPFGADLLFEIESAPNAVLGIEICEDLWVSMPPSSAMAVAGATLLLNLSASVETVAKADYRRALVTQQ